MLWFDPVAPFPGYGTTLYPYILGVNYIDSANCCGDAHISSTAFPQFSHRLPKRMAFEPGLLRLVVGGVPAA
jgi:hypothetical protein